MAETISSLYGPGAIICWLCTAISVLLSWYFNRSSQRYDTITNDFAGCLLLPAIAITHLVHELTRTNKGSKATLSMEATFMICKCFQPIGSLLCAQALFNLQRTRLVLTAAVTVPCLVMVIVVFATSGTKMPDFDFGIDHALLPVLLNLTIYPIWMVKFLREVMEKPAKDRQITLCIFPIIGALQFMGSSLYLYNSKVDDSQHTGTLLPKTPYSLSDFDQAVALSIGIITLLLCIVDIVLDFNFSPKDEFEHWRIRCVQNIEDGDTDVEITRWKQDLESIDKKAKIARTRAKHWEREQKTYAELPRDVKNALRSYEIDRNLRWAGLL
jgi:hypothetical protein